MPGLLRCDRGDYARVLHLISHARLRVHWAPGIPCALCYRGSKKFTHNSGASRRENVGLCPVGCLKLNQLHPRRPGGTTRAFVLYSARLLIFLTQTRTSASTSGSAALTSATVMPALMRGSYRMFRMYWS